MTAPLLWLLLLLLPPPQFSPCGYPPLAPYGCNYVCACDEMGCRWVLICR